MFPILTIVGGLITASPVIVARKPESRKVLARIAPYQGILGVAVLALGVLWLVRWLPNLRLSFATLDGALVLAMIAADILVGLLLGYGLLSALAARNEATRAKSEALLLKLTSLQVPLGLGAVALGLASFVL